MADAWGLMAAGAVAPGVPAMLRAAAELGPGRVAVPYAGGAWSPQGAAAAGSALIHGWDFDDTHDRAVVHTAAIAVPAALSAAQMRPASGSDFADGVVAGVQALTRLAELVGPRPGVIRTAGLGAPAAAAAVAATWGLGEAGVRNAMALAVGMALGPSSRQAVADSSLSKRVQPGLAIQAGMYAASLAAQNVHGPDGWLTGEFGLAPGASTGEGLLEAPFAGAEVSIKPYPACRYGHAAIAAAEQLAKAHGRDASTDEIIVHLPEGPAYAMVARAFEDRGEPIIDAQFSVPWQVASVWITGVYDVATLAGPDVTNPAVADFARAKVSVLQDLPPSSVMSGATVTLQRGTEQHRCSAAMPGSPEAPLKRDDVALKLASCLAVAGLDSEHGIDDVWDFVDQVDTLDHAQLQTRLRAF